MVGHRPQGAFALPGELDPGIPPAIDRLVARCLAADPANRFADGAELLAALRAAGRSAWTEVERDLRSVRALLANSEPLSALQEGLLLIGSVGFTVLSAVGASMIDEPIDVRPGQVVPTDTPLWWLRLTAGLVAGLVLYLLSRRRVAPWRTRRRRSLRELELRLALQWRAIGAAFRRVT